ncbi:BON domain-containing protein [Oceanicaulis alexandrii]|uniref:BON domain-containing protein n=1 Tax=Oceanicaulis alexandrii TaxID=153233 RepID=UPI0003B38DB0|nr:BON domain-containing protein [Oceanicaulis alexandrii]
MTVIRIVLLVLATVVLTSCAAFQPGRSVGRQVDDFNASVSLKSAMLRAEGYALNGVDVEITEGVALLTGRAPRAEDRVYAECLAWSVQSVRSVSNQIELGGRRGLTNATRDGWITQQVRSRLASDSAIRSLNFNIETHSGVVYLLGFARSSAESDRAAAHAALVEGVERVVVLTRAPDVTPNLPARGAQQAQACDLSADPEA